MSKKMKTKKATTKRTNNENKDFQRELKKIRETLSEKNNDSVTTLRQKQQKEKSEKITKDLKLANYKENSGGFYDMNVATKKLTEEEISFLKEETSIIEKDEVFKMNENSKEFWKDIPGYVGYYQISNKGNLRSVDRYVGEYNRRISGKMLKLKNKHKNSFNDRGYTLCKDGVSHYYNVFTLLGKTFYDENINDYTFIRPLTDFENEEEFIWLNNLSVDKVFCMANVKGEKENECYEFSSTTQLLSFLSDNERTYYSILKILDLLKYFKYDEDSQSIKVTDFEKDKGITLYFIRGKYRSFLERRILKRDIIYSGNIFKSEYLGVKFNGKEIIKALTILYRMPETEENKEWKRQARRLYAIYVRDTDYPLSPFNNYIITSKVISEEYTRYDIKNVTKEEILLKAKKEGKPERKKYYYLKNKDEYVSDYNIENDEIVITESTTKFEEAIILSSDDMLEISEMCKKAHIRPYYVMVV